MPFHSGSNATPSAKLATAALPRRVAAVLERVLALVGTEMQGHLGRMLNEFEQQLFLLADHARNPALQSGHLDTLAKVKVNRGRLLPGFLREVEAQLAGIRANSRRNDADGDERAMPFRNLSLVDDQDLDEESVLRDISMRLEARASLPLHLLGQRFGVLAGCAAFDAERIPVGPRAFAQALRESSKALQIGPDARLLLFKAFERVVMANYDQFAKLVNDLLVKEGVLPSLNYVPLRVRPPGEAATVPSAANDADQAGRAMQAWYGWPSEPGPGAGSAIEDGALFSMLKELLAERRVPGTGVAAAAPSPASAPSATEAAAEAVSTMADTVRSDGGQPAGEERDATELVELLYRQVQQQVRPDSKAQDLLAKLQGPLAQLASADPGIFTQARHPARQLLNAVAESGAKWTPEGETDPQLPEHLERVVEEVASADKAGPDVFEAANRKLQQHLQQLARKAEVAERRQVEAARGKEKLELAKRRATEVIEAEVRNQPLSRFVMSLLKQAWADVLTLTLLRHGEDSDEWGKRLAATREVVGIAVQQDGLAFNPSLTGLVRDALVQVGYHAEDAQAIARRLTTGIGDDDDPASRTELAMRLKSRARLGEVNAAMQSDDRPYSPAEQVAFQHLRALPAGSWFEFRQPEGGHLRRRLSWYSTVTNTTLFVNQRGQRVEQMSLRDVVRMLAEGELRAVTAENGPLVDAAWRSAIDALRAGRQGGGTHGP